MEERGKQLLVTGAGLSEIGLSLPCRGSHTLLFTKVQTCSQQPCKKQTEERESFRLVADAQILSTNQTAYGSHL